LGSDLTVYLIQEDTIGIRFDLLFFVTWGCIEHCAVSQQTTELLVDSK